MATRQVTQRVTAHGRGSDMEATDDLSDVLAALPPHICQAVQEELIRGHNGPMIEIVLDLGRKPEARFETVEVDLSDLDVTRDDLQYVESHIGVFGDDNRAGIERTLHRISAIRNRTNDIVGLTFRVGRAVYGTIAILSDLIDGGQSVLLLGRPGVGKTTMLREIARVLADDLRKRVVIVDTSNEIAGDGDIPHPAIGRARRMQVPTPTAQHSVMIEAVENHMPEVIVIDEIGTELEAMAARTIAERGVQLIGTAHGNTLENLMMNPVLADLVGGIQSVTLSDEEARRRGTQKSILERKGPPTFNILVEINTRDEVAVHRDVSAVVDSILRGAPVKAEVRTRSDDGGVSIASPQPEPEKRASRSAARLPETRPGSAMARAAASWFDEGEEQDESEPAQAVGPRGAFLDKGRGTAQKPIRILPFGISRNRLESAIRDTNTPATIVREIHEADMIMTLKNYYRQKPQPIRDAEARGMPVYVLRSNTLVQMEGMLTTLVPSAQRPVSVDRADTYRPTGRPSIERGYEQAMEETEVAINAVIEGSAAISLLPQSSHIRKLQHQLADRYNLASRSRGREPHRHVEIFREGIQ